MHKKQYSEEILPVLDEKSKSMRVTRSAPGSISSPAIERKKSISQSGLAQLLPQVQRALSDAPLEMLARSMRPRTADRTLLGKKIKTDQPAFLPLPLLPSILQDPSVSVQKKRGHEAFARGDWKQAFLYYDDAMKKDTGMKYTKVILRRGMCLEKMGQYSQAVVDYATCYNLTGQASDLENVQRMERKLHQEAFPHLTDGEAALTKGEHERAVGFFTRAIMVAGDFAEPYFKRGTCYERIGRFREAIDDMIKADYRSKVITMKTRCRQAVTRLEGKLHPAAEKHKQLGDKAYDSKQWGDAIGHYTAAIEADSQYASPWVNRGLAYEKQGNLVAALADLVQAHKLMTRPDGSSRCVEVIDKIFKKLHKNGMWAKKKGDKAVINENWGLGVWWYTRAISSDRTFPHPYYNRAVCREHLGQFSEALADYIQARELFKREDLVLNCQRAIERIKRLMAGKPPASPGRSETSLLDFTDPLELARQRSESKEPETTFLDLTEEKQRARRVSVSEEAKEEQGADEVSAERSRSKGSKAASPVSDLLKWGEGKEQKASAVVASDSRTVGEARTAAAGAPDGMDMGRECCSPSQEELVQPAALVKCYSEPPPRTGSSDAALPSVKPLAFSRDDSGCEVNVPTLIPEGAEQGASVPTAQDPSAIVKARRELPALVIQPRSSIKLKQVPELEPMITASSSSPDSAEEQRAVAESASGLRSSSKAQLRRPSSRLRELSQLATPLLAKDKAASPGTPPSLLSGEPPQSS